ncbi:Ras-related protein [Venturia nashicola]|uniref:Ras-related protein n=1 Tax=Venturia nashicola TaxID=86259 RepID=A0A4Z1P157_9PEZI|nr:Ras-related protein [Venturia nashicola]
MTKRKFSQNGMAKPKSKKCKQADDPSNDTMTESATKITNIKPRVTFLTLPREIRQKILYHSCELGISVGVKHEKILLFYSPISMNNISLYKHGLEEQRNSAWASLLVGIHEVVDQDMAFVRKQWKDEIEEVLSTCTTEGRWMRWVK